MYLSLSSKILACLLLSAFLFSGSAFSLNKQKVQKIQKRNLNPNDSLVYTSDLYSLYRNVSHGLYSLTDTQRVVRYDSIKVFYPYPNGVQIITHQNELLNIPVLPADNYYDQPSFVPVQAVGILEQQFFVCGTVPHYELSIRETPTSFDLYRDETFYDSGNQIPAEKYLSIDKKYADAVFFINQKKTYTFSSNEMSQYSETPIIKKNGSYRIGLNSDSSQNYTSVVWTGDDFLVEEDGLYSFYSLDKEPKYTKLASFVGHFARFTHAQGASGYLTRTGEEIRDKSR